MEFGAWERTVPELVRVDPLWTTRAYRLAGYLAHCVTEESKNLNGDPAGRVVLPQLVLAVNSIGANIAEGYSRSRSRDRAKFFEYALGSAREARHWWLGVRDVLGNDRLERRVASLDETIRLLVTMVRRQRASR